MSIGRTKGSANSVAAKSVIKKSSPVRSVAQKKQILSRLKPPTQDDRTRTILPQLWRELVELCWDFHNPLECTLIWMQIDNRENDPHNLSTGMLNYHAKISMRVGCERISAIIANQTYGPAMALQTAIGSLRARIVRQGNMGIRGLERDLPACFDWEDVTGFHGEVLREGNYKCDWGEPVELWKPMEFMAAQQSLLFSASLFDLVFQSRPNLIEGDTVHD